MNHYPATVYKQLAISAKCAAISYLDAEDMMKTWSSYTSNSDDLVYSVFRGVSEPPKHHHDATTDGDVYTWIQYNTFYICFRGTSTPHDILIDLTCTLTPLFPAENASIRIHNGFHTQFRALFPGIRREFNAAHQAGRIQKCLCTGHSLGAALATITAGMLAKEYSNIQMVCHTFGSPRVGNTAFARWFSNYVSDSIRVANYRDPIPLCSIFCSYQHVGNAIYLDGLKSIFVPNDDHWIWRILCFPCRIDCCHIVERHMCNVYMNRLLQLSEIPPPLERP